MKKLILFVIVLSFVACKPKVVYMDDSEFCYVDTEDGRLWGIYRGTQQILEPIYDTITPVLDKRAYYAAEKGTYRLYSIYTDNFTLCDGAELIEQPEFSSDFSGLPYKYTRINTTSGFYALYYVEPWAKWYCYGPFKEYVPAMAGIFV
ncbi:MAG: hypothetical protein E7095_10270 [Bacteroides sp.]|nr:hypothetical protein [Bacteroides sp.]